MIRGGHDLEAWKIDQVDVLAPGPGEDMALHSAANFRGERIFQLFGCLQKRDLIDSLLPTLFTNSGHLPPEQVRQMSLAHSGSIATNDGDGSGKLGRNKRPKVESNSSCRNTGHSSPRN